MHLHAPVHSRLLTVLVLFGALALSSSTTVFAEDRDVEIVTKRLLESDTNIWHTALSRDDRFVAVGVRGEIQVIALPSGKTEFKLPSGASMFGLSPDGSLVASAGNGGLVVVNRDSGDTVGKRTLPSTPWIDNRFNAARTHRIEFVSNEKLVVVSGNSIVGLDLQSGKESIVLPDKIKHYSFNCSAVSLDQSLLAVGTESGKILVFDISDPTNIVELKTIEPSRPGSVEGLSISEDGMTIYGLTVNLRENPGSRYFAYGLKENGEVRRSLAVHQQSIASAIGPGGRVFIRTDGEEKLRLLDSVSGRWLKTDSTIAARQVKFTGRKPWVVGVKDHKSLWLFVVGTNLQGEVESGQSSRVSSALRHQRKASLLPKYQQEFGEIRTSVDAEQFINRWKGDDDFEGLVAKADEMKPRLKQSEMAAEEEARKRAIAAEEAARKRVLVESQQLTVWRKSLKVESETNCGPVLEVKGNLLKVYSPVRDYGNEHWIKRELLFMPGAGCRFENGSYSGR